MSAPTIGRVEPEARAPGRRRGRRWSTGWTSWHAARLAVLGAVVAIVLGPLVPVLVSAVNDGPMGGQGFQGFTLAWFAEAVTRTEFVRGFLTSVRVAAGATIVALLVGVPAAFALTRGPAWVRGSFVSGIVMSPIVIPQIVVSLAMLQLLSGAGVRLGLPGLTAAHAAFVLPFVVRAASAALAAQGSAFEMVAMSLGASKPVVLATVTLPMLRPALVAGGVIAFTLSFVNVPLSLFLAPSNARTLPIVMYQFLEFSLRPVIAALAVLLFLAMLLLALVLERVLKVGLLQ